MFKKMIEYLSKLCYDKFRIGCKNMKKIGIFSAKELACYIKKRYSDSTKETKTITTIKLQKSLYFCFAYWAGFVKKGKIDKTIQPDMNEVLFDEKFEAWAYGPVVPSVYFNEKNPMLFNNKAKEEAAIKKVELEFKNNTLLQETIDSLLDDIFEISDFKLVSISHMDNSWKNHFHEYEKKHNEEIPKKEIIDEYTTKGFN